MPALRALAAMASVIAMLLAPAGALAQDDGVFIDPDSPSAKEYEIPTESARREASGRKGKVKSGARDAPLFGEGIEDRSATPTPTPTSPPERRSRASTQSSD